jgi:DNA-binding beta-propeller fold protein YncE
MPVKKVRFAFSLAVLLTSLSSPRAASAKAATIEITISGGGLPSAVEITDPQILALSNVWSGQFLDTSRTPEREPPKGLLPYEVSFFVKLAENDVRKAYVAYYYPSSSKQQGYIYFPGRPGPIWWLNAGTILRNGRHGTWNYASAAWEALIKPVIARAREQRKPALTSEAAVRDSYEFSEASPIKTDGWTKPRSGWLYILDPRAESDRPGSRIWLLDPQTKTVMGSVHAGYDTDFALSPDGSQLYVVSGERESGEIAVIDTASGKVLHTPFPDRVLYNPWYDGLPPFSEMTVSSDGRALHILQYHVLSPDTIAYQLWTFDTQSRRFADTRLDLGDCGDAVFVPSSTASQVAVLCPASNTLRLVQLDAEYRETSSILVKLPWPRTCGVVEGFLSPVENKLVIVRADGGLYRMDLSTREFSPAVVAGDCRNLFFPLQWPHSPRGRKLYLGDGTLATDNMSTATELRILDTVTGQRLASIRTSVPVWSAASNKGRLVYALAPRQHSVLVIDTAALEENSTIPVGNVPSLALVAP